MGDIESVYSPSMVVLREFRGNSGAGGTPPLPSIFKPFLAAASLSDWQAWAVVFDVLADLERDAVS